MLKTMSDLMVMSMYCIMYILKICNKIINSLDVVRSPVIGIGARNRDATINNIIFKINPIYIWTRLAKQF